jgi:hypothetical protein
MITISLYLNRITCMLKFLSLSSHRLAVFGLDLLVGEQGLLWAELLLLESTARIVLRSCAL